MCGPQPSTIYETVKRQLLRTIGTLSFRAIARAVSRWLLIADPGLYVMD